LIHKLEVAKETTVTPERFQKLDQTERFEKFDDTPINETSLITGQTPGVITLLNTPILDIHTGNNSISN
jgi:hypothetical protein